MVDDSKNNNCQSEKYGQNIKPRLQQILQALRLDVTYSKAEGDSLWWTNFHKEEKRVYDFLGGYGSTILGHNHPLLCAEILKCIENKVPFHSQLSIRGGAAELGAKINLIFIDVCKFNEEYFIHFFNTGTEAVEAAIKHALMEWIERRDTFLFGLRVANSRRPAMEPEEFRSVIDRIEKMEPCFLSLENSFHGKTMGSVTVTQNLNYKYMYGKGGLKVDFVSKDVVSDEFSDLVNSHTFSVPGHGLFCGLAGFLIEPIQAEGGVHVVSRDTLQMVVSCLAEKNVPILVDEIQTGIYRTGLFLVSQSFDKSPDYIMLGKSLGGGVAKISALAIKKSRYLNDFGILHTSTFAEDDWSARLSLKTLEYCLEHQEKIVNRAEEFEMRLRSHVGKIQSQFPDVISEIRGKGFLLGIEFNCQNLFRYSEVLEQVGRSGLITYLLSSYLLHKHGVRLAPTLNQTNTLRVEPSWNISDEGLAQLMTGMSDVAQIIWSGEYQKLFDQLYPEWKNDTVEPEQHMVPQQRTHPAVTFLIHYISENSLKDIEPALRNWPDHLLQTMISAMAPFATSMSVYEQVIHGKNGSAISVNLRGIPESSRFFEASLRKGTKDAFVKVIEAAESAVDDRAGYVGLGQYTSIVTDNGILLKDIPVPITTGNSLTVGMSYRAFLKMAAERGLDTKKLRVGVVGIAGNICSVLAQLIADDIRELVIVHRENLNLSSKLKFSIEQLLLNSKISKDKIISMDDFSVLKTCDCVILGTNSTLKLLRPEHLKKDAFVIDISVPTNVDPIVQIERPDVQCIQGGLVQLPMGQKFGFAGMKELDGEIYACLAETITAGLLGLNRSLSLGSLSKSGVLEVLRMADEVGMELGKLKTIRTF